MDGKGDCYLIKRTTLVPFGKRRTSNPIQVLHPLIPFGARRESIHGGSTPASLLRERPQNKSTDTSSAESNPD